MIINIRGEIKSGEFISSEVDCVICFVEPMRVISTRLFGKSLLITRGETNINSSEKSFWFSFIRRQVFDFDSDLDSDSDFKSDSNFEPDSKISHPNSLERMYSVRHDVYRKSRSGSVFARVV